MKAEIELNLKQSIYLPIKYSFFFCFIASLKRKELRDLLNAQLAQSFN